MLTRIVTVADDGQHSTGGESLGSDHELCDLAGHSYGITSDPLTQFAVIFSALIHDAGKPNIALVFENVFQRYPKRRLPLQNTLVSPTHNW